MPRASGFQMAFLILAVAFFAMLLSRWAVPRLGWPGLTVDFAGTVISLAIAAAVLFGVSPLRRHCLDALGKALPESFSRELIVVTLAKAVIPFAILGAVVAWAFIAGSPDRIFQEMRSFDSAAAWASSLSPAELAKLVIVAWLAGPILEELVFRGLLYRAWERQWGWGISLLLTSTCFGLAHPTHVTSAFMGSVVYVCLLRRSGSLRAPILVHMVFNVLISWPLLGHLLFLAPEGNPASLATWALPLASLTFMSIAFPVYVWMARREHAPARSPEPSAG